MSTKTVCDLVNDFVCQLVDRYACHTRHPVMTFSSPWLWERVAVELGAQAGDVYRTEDYGRGHITINTAAGPVLIYREQPAAALAELKGRVARLDAILVEGYEQLGRLKQIKDRFQ